MMNAATVLGLGNRPAPHRAHIPPDRPGPPQRGAATGDPLGHRSARPTTAGHATAVGRAARAVPPRPFRELRDLTRYRNRPGAWPAAGRCDHHPDPVGTGDPP
jgi:hypothetical protein